MISTVNTTIASLSTILLKLGVMNASVSQAADKFANTAESAFKNAREVLFTNLV